MKVFLLRHATRNFTIGDVPLNEEGKEEAESLAINSQLQNIHKIICSPKKRALMTVTPLSDRLGVPIETDPNLDQMSRGEDERSFRQRVANVLETIESFPADQNVLLCSHSDWLGVAAHIIPTDDIHLKNQMFSCASFASFEINDGLWKRLS